MKALKNQRGFAAFEILILLLLVGVLGFVGYRAYTARNVRQEKNQPSVTAQTVKPGFRLYEDKSVTLQYPDDWAQYTQADSPEWVYFKSPDYEPSDVPAGSVVKKGLLFEVRVSKNEGRTYSEDLQNAPEAQKNHGGTYETIEVDGNKSILSNTVTHGCGWYATVYLGAQEYFFRANCTGENSDEAKALIKNILSTVELKQ